MTSNSMSAGGNALPRVLVLCTSGCIALHYAQQRLSCRDRTQRDVPTALLLPQCPLVMWSSFAYHHVVLPGPLEDMQLQGQ